MWVSIPGSDTSNVIWFATRDVFGVTYKYTPELYNIIKSICRMSEALHDAPNGRDITTIHGRGK